jgi:phosphopantetheinyl transferase
MSSAFYSRKHYNGKVFNKRGGFCIWRLQKGAAYIYFIETNNNDIPLQYLYLLDEEEVGVYSRYKVDFKKTEFLVGRVLAKSVLSKYLEIRPEDICFIKNNYGKLYLKEHLRYKTGNVIQFNIAHSCNMIVCAVTLDNEIGVDVGKVNSSILDKQKDLLFLEGLHIRI